MKFLNGILFVFSHPLNKENFFSTFFRLIWWKCNQLFFHLPTVVLLTNKIRCICYPDSSYGSLIIYTRLPEYEEMNYVLKTLQKDSVFVDIGAGLGDYSLLAASKINKGKIFAFEPHPIAFKQLLENVRLNRLEKTVSTYNIALSNQTGKVSFLANDVSELSSISLDKNFNTIEVATITIDEFCQKNELSKIDLMKIDVEGAEHLVLSGANKFLSQHRIKRILIELNPRSETLVNKSVEDTLVLLERAKYTFFKFDRKLFRVSIEQIISDGKTQNILAMAKE